jgi:hypothetical protein
MAASSALVITAGPALAATGQLILHSSGRDVVLTNPSAGCQTSLGGFSEATNNTNVYVTVYTDTRCRDFGLVVSPGSSVQVGDRHSVRVPS